MPLCNRDPNFDYDLENGIHGTTYLIHKFVRVLMIKRNTQFSIPFVPFVPLTVKKYF